VKAGAYQCGVRAGQVIRPKSPRSLIPCARVRGFLNRSPLDCELPPEGARFDGLAERQLLSGRLNRLVKGLYAPYVAAFLIHWLLVRVQDGPLNDSR
jgi:hypothetical protein